MAAALSEPMTRGHQERLAAMARDAAAMAGADFSDLSGVAVTLGPGSFTGLRVGLAFAKGLVLALGVPGLGVSSLAALAASVEGGERRTAVIAAGRGRVWRQIFRGDVEDSVAECVGLDELADGGLLIGPAAGVLAGPGQAFVDRAAPGLSAIAALAQRRPLPLTPLYLRPPDAKPKAA
jgi:tRNA threonylcarbamoyladenosine biosynthesis protein TsaB